MAIAKKKPAVKKAVAAPAKTAAKKTVAVKKAPVKKTVLKTVTAAKTAAVKRTPLQKKPLFRKPRRLRKPPRQRSKQCSIPLPPGLFQPTRVPEPCFTFVLPLSSLFARREERGIAYIPNIPNGEATRCKPLKNALVGAARHALRRSHADALSNAEHFFGHFLRDRAQRPVVQPHRNLDAITDSKLAFGHSAQCRARKCASNRGQSGSPSAANRAARNAACQGAADRADSAGFSAICLNLDRAY